MKKLTITILSILSITSICYSQNPIWNIRVDKNPEELLLKKPRSGNFAPSINHCDFLEPINNSLSFLAWQDDRTILFLEYEKWTIQELYKKITPYGKLEVSIGGMMDCCYHFHLERD